MLTTDLIEALIVNFGPIGAAILIMGFMIWHGYRSSKKEKTEPPAKDAKGLPPEDKLWFITEIRDPILNAVSRLRGD